MESEGHGPLTELPLSLHTGSTKSRDSWNEKPKFPYVAVSRCGGPSLGLETPCPLRIICSLMVTDGKLFSCKGARRGVEALSDQLWLKWLSGDGVRFRNTYRHVGGCSCFHPLPSCPDQILYLKFLQYKKNCLLDTPTVSRLLMYNSNSPVGLVASFSPAAGRLSWVIHAVQSQDWD